MNVTVFKNCNVFDGFSPSLLPNMTVVVSDGMIIEVVSGDYPGNYPGESTEIIDLNGKTLMPGLIDAHVHVYAHEANLSHNDDAPIEHRVLHARSFMEASLNRGFTTLRDAGGADHHLANALEQGLLNGPRLFYSGLALSQTGGHGDFRLLERSETCACAYGGAISTIADGVDEVRKAAREQLRKGAHQIKIMASGGTASPADPIWMMQFSDEEILAAVEEASRLKTYVMAHAYTAPAIRRCIELGVRSIEHGNLIDYETACYAAEKNAFIVPTLSTYNALAAYGEKTGWTPEGLKKVNEVKAKGVAALEVCKSAGVKMGFGSDLLGEMHVYQYNEFTIRSEVLSPFEILHSATAVNAELLNMEGLLGVISPNALADIIVVDGNPLEDFSLFQRDGGCISLVMKNGVLYKNSL